MIVERPMQSESEMSRRDLLIDQTRAIVPIGTDPLDSSRLVKGYVLREELCTDPYARFWGQTEAAASSDPICVGGSAAGCVGGDGRAFCVG